MISINFISARNAMDSIEDIWQLRKKAKERIKEVEGFVKCYDYVKAKRRTNLESYIDGLNEKYKKLADNLRLWASLCPEKYDNCRIVIEEYYCTDNNGYISLQDYLDEYMTEEEDSFKEARVFKERIRTLDMKMIEEGIYMPN